MGQKTISTYAVDDSASVKVVASDPTITSLLVYNVGPDPVLLSAVAVNAAEGQPLGLGKFLVFHDVTDALYARCANGDDASVVVTAIKGGGRLDAVGLSENFAPA